MTLPFGITGSLSPTFVSARIVTLAVKLPYAFTLYDRFPPGLREPLSTSVTVWEVTAPVKLPTRHCPYSGLQNMVRYSKLSEWYFNDDSATTSVVASQSPTYATQILPNTSVKL